MLTYLFASTTLTILHRLRGARFTSPYLILTQPSMVNSVSSMNQAKDYLFPAECFVKVSLPESIKDAVLQELPNKSLQQPSGSLSRRLQRQSARQALAAAEFRR